MNRLVLLTAAIWLTTPLAAEATLDCDNATSNVEMTACIWQAYEAAEC
ncbi:hypothetical protein [Bauldia sp.]